MSFYEAVFGIEKKVVIKRTEKCISCVNATIAKEPVLKKITDNQSEYSSRC
jgi:DnaJ-class molecular chaperone